MPNLKKLENIEKEIVKDNYYPNLSTRNNYNLHFSIVSILLYIGESTLKFLDTSDFKPNTLL